MTQKGKLVLVVDDSADVRNIISSALEQMDMAPVEAQDGVLALLEFRERGPMNFIGAIIDLMMPNLDGIQVIKELKQENPKLIAILCTGYPDLLGKNHGHPKTFDAILQKPFHIEQFKTVFFKAILNA